MYHMLSLIFKIILNISSKNTKNWLIIHKLVQLLIIPMTSYTSILHQLTNYTIKIKIGYRLEFKTFEPINLLVRKNR